MSITATMPALRRWTLMIVGLAASLTWFVSIPPALATEHLVLADGSGPYPNIQFAIDACSQGDTVVVGAGTYTGVNNRDFNTENDMLIRAQYPGDEVTIDLQGSAADPHMGFDQVDGSLTLEGLTIQNAYGTWGAVQVRTADFTAIDCNFFNNTADRGGAVALDNGDRLVLDGCVFAWNTANIQGGAVYGTAFGDIVMTNCTFFMNACDDGAAVYRAQDATLDMTACITTFSRGTYTFTDYYGGAVTVTDSDVWGNEGTDWSSLGVSPGTNGNISADPLLCDPMDGNFALTSGSPCWVPPSVVMGGGGLDLSWEVPVYGLRDDGSGMYPTIQAAADAVPARADIVLEGGSYLGPGNRDIGFGGKWIELSVRDGGFAGIYPRNHTGEPAARAFHLHEGEPVGTAIRGVYIAGGQAEGLPSYPGFGGAVLVTGGASVILEDVEFYSHFASFGGAVLAVVGPAGEVTMDNCSLNSTSWSAAVYASGGTLEIVDTNFGANNDGSLELASGIVAATVRNSWIHDTHGIYALDIGSAPVLLEDCTLERSAAFTTSSFLACDNVTLSRCVLRGDGITGGSLLSVQLSTVVLDSCTFTYPTILNENVAAIESRNSNLDIGRSTFYRIATDGTRGLLDLDQDATVSLDSCSFSRVSTVIDGATGGDLDLTMTACVFDTVETALRITGAPLDQVAISDTEFIECMQGIELVDCPDVVLTGCGFRGIGPEEPIRSTNSHLTVIGCEFHDSEVWDGPGYEAGVILASGGDLLVLTSEFLRNRCGAGAGAIGTTDTFVSINDCVFEDNVNAPTATVESGGAISCRGSGGIYLGGSRLARNTAYEGGAVFAETMSATIEDCEFIDNTADSDGGALYLNPGLAGQMGLFNNVFAGNTAADQGGAIQIQEAQDVDIYRCTFVGNGGSAGVAQISTNATVALDMRFSIIAHGTDGPVLQAAYEPGLTLNVACTDIIDNAAGDWTGVLAPFASVAGNVSLLPGFCDRTAGNYHLAADSPCLDTANGCGTTMGALDVGCGNVSATPDTPVIRAVSLRQNRPNPFNPSTRILFELPVEADVTLSVYDVAGRLVRKLLVGERFRYGGHEVAWNGRDDRGRAQATGTYLYRLQADGVDRVRKMTLVR